MGDKPKAITDFFASKTTKRQLDKPNGDSAQASKKLVTSAVTSDGARQTVAVSVSEPAGDSGQTTLISPKATPVAPPPEQLSEQELRELCSRHSGVIKALVQQAEGRGELPSLDDLLREPTWRQHLEGEFKKPYMSKLQTFLHSEWKAKTIFPPKDLIFRAMNGTPFEQVRVVIIGQDPYHNVGQAMGLSFSVPPGQRVPPSLQNIYKELKTDVGFTPPKHGNLEKWSFQGVLLLNAALTVRAHEANSHNKQGWEDFTTAAIQALSKHRRGLVFLLWGKNAQAVEKLINVSKHHILKTVHPSGLSANRGFFGCKHFSKANKLLEKEGLPPIEWQLPLEG